MIFAGLNWLLQYLVMNLESTWARKPSIKHPFFSFSFRGLRLILYDMVVIFVRHGDDSELCEDGLEIVGQMIAHEDQKQETSLFSLFVHLRFLMISHGAREIIMSQLLMVNSHFEPGQQVTTEAFNFFLRRLRKTGQLGQKWCDTIMSFVADYTGTQIQMHSGIIFVAGTAPSISCTP